MHQALYRKWRPGTFDEVSGQDHITSVLRYEVAEGKLSHAYLFCGSRGVGKTTCAKILAKAANCLSPVNGDPCGVCESCRAIESGAATDVLEMDAASNNGVENIRDIRDEVMYAPSNLKYRVYIVDEVHMLSQSAFNALLKTLEEPPSYVIFILATTEQHKLPATIISRCQRFEFRRISVAELASRLEFIAKEENISVTPDAAVQIARLAQGGMRDAISLLELCAGGGRSVTPEIVNETVGSTGREGTMRMAVNIANKNYDAIFADIAETVRSSMDLSIFMRDLLSLWRDLLVFKTLPDPSRYLDLTDNEKKTLAELAKIYSKETLLWQSALIENAISDMQRPGASKRTSAELALLRMCDEQLDSSNEALLSRIAKLENAILTGQINLAPIAPVAFVPEKEAEVKVQKVEATPAAKPEIKAPAVEPEPKKEPEPIKPEPKKEDSKPVQRRSLRCFAEVVERIQSTHFLASTFLKTAKAAVEGDAVTLFVASDFAKDSIEEPNVLSSISAALASLTGKNYKIEIKVGIPGADTFDDTPDEILDNAEEF